MSRRSVVPLGTLAAIAVAMVLSHTTTTLAQSSDEDARRHFEAGESYFRTSDYDGALREFNQAYQLADAGKRPAILLSIASVYERMGDLSKTVETLQKWLAEAPADNKDRPTIELRIQNLDKRIRELAAAPPASPSAAPPATAPAATSSTAPPPPPPPEPNRTPAYITWGIGGAAAVGAVITGLIANKKYNDADAGCAKTPQGCSDSEVSPIKNMALVSTILTGVAVVGGGVGTYLYLSASSPAQERATGPVPLVSAGVTHHGGAFEATWRF